MAVKTKPDLTPEQAREKLNAYLDCYRSGFDSWTHQTFGWWPILCVPESERAEWEQRRREAISEWKHGREARGTA